MEHIIVISFVSWLFLSVIVAVVASSKGRSGFGYFLLSLLISPLITLVVLLVLGEHTKVTEQRAVSSGAMKKCPFCAEMIKVDAIFCRYCGKDQPEKEQAKEPDRVICPSCQQEKPANAVVCPHCNAWVG